MAEADLASAVAGSAIAAPSHGLVKGDGLSVTSYGPEYRLPVAVNLQVM